MEEEDSVFGPGMEKSYILPDGQTFSLEKPRFQCAEVLFNPGLIDIDDIGIHAAISSAIKKSNADVRKVLAKNIVLAGGTCLLPCLSDRVFREVSGLVPASYQVNVIAQRDRKHAAWIGGAVLSSLSTFAEMCITKEEYEEAGESVIQKKCL